MGLLDSYDQYLVNIQAILKLSYYHPLGGCTKNPLAMDSLLEIIQSRKKFQLDTEVISQ